MCVHECACVCTCIHVHVSLYRPYVCVCACVRACVRDIIMNVRMYVVRTYTYNDIQCCQSVIRKLVYGFMCRLDSSVNCILKGILATSLRYTSRIRKHWCSLLSINS